MSPGPIGNGEEREPEAHDQADDAYDGERLDWGHVCELCGVEIRSRFGYLFQSSALLAWINVFENVALPLRENTKLAENEIRDRVCEALEKVGLGKEGDAFPADLSGGMRKRAGLARAIVTEPEILLYDEPTSGLDPVTARMIDQLIVDLNNRLGTTSVVVTHDLHSALSISDRIAMLSGGKVVDIKPPAEFIRSELPIIKSFLDAQYITRRGSWEKEKAL